MKLSDYVKALANLNDVDTMEIDVGIDIDNDKDIIVSYNSPNRIRFTIKKQHEVKK